MSLLSSVAYIRIPDATYRTQAATNGNIKILEIPTVLTD